MKIFNGEILFLDRADINTDEIIPARYLTEVDKEALKPHLLEDLCLDGFLHGRDIEGKRVIVSRSNFGCGSSREHAAWALEVNGIHLVIAESFARIFRQNMFNCGMMALELPAKSIDRLFVEFAKEKARLRTDFDRETLTMYGSDREAVFDFSLSTFDRALVEAGGWVEFADQRY
jgi:3-isopropylmalate/(R)-2-methylmalate dehydratase small subunit